MIHARRIPPRGGGLNGGSLRGCRRSDKRSASDATSRTVPPWGSIAAIVGCTGLAAGLSDLRVAAFKALRRSAKRSAPDTTGQRLSRFAQVGFVGRISEAHPTQQPSPCRRRAGIAAIVGCTGLAAGLSDLWGSGFRGLRRSDKRSASDETAGAPPPRAGGQSAAPFRRPPRTADRPPPASSPVNIAGRSRGATPG